ncbi:MAG: dihydrofolate reductase [Acidimicrobiia bacterium]
MPVTLVAAVARNRVIGRHGGLPWHIPGDLPRFKRLTLGHTLVMGRRTYESIGRPLPGRRTIVVSRRHDWQPEGVTVVGSVEAALREAGADEEEVFVVGGGEIYRQTLDRAEVLELTEVDAEPDGDVLFPEVDWSRWEEVSRRDHPGHSFVTYRRSL